MVADGGAVTHYVPPRNSAQPSTTHIEVATLTTTTTTTTTSTWAATLSAPALSMILSMW